ncbi:MAG: response regulator [Armatimonadetes bacterium]|nr:response regulator [Armatimonadota bacterium]
MADGRVLVVDDEPDHGLTVRAILARDAVAVDFAASPEDALAQACQQTYDVAILDLRMPGRDGLSLMHALRRGQPSLRVIILTAYPSPTTCRTALTEGASAYLEKPCAPEALRAMVASLLAQSSKSP